MSKAVSYTHLAKKSDLLQFLSEKEWMRFSVSLVLTTLSVSYTHLVWLSGTIIWERFGCGDRSGYGCIPIYQKQFSGSWYPCEYTDDNHWCGRSEVFRESGGGKSCPGKRAFVGRSSTDSWNNGPWSRVFCSWSTLLLLLRTCLLYTSRCV